MLVEKTTLSTMIRVHLNSQNRVIEKLEKYQVNESVSQLTTLLSLNKNYNNYIYIK